MFGHPLPTCKCAFMKQINGASWILDMYKTDPRLSYLGLQFFLDTCIQEQGLDYYQSPTASYENPG